MALANTTTLWTCFGQETSTDQRSVSELGYKSCCNLSLEKCLAHAQRHSIAISRYLGRGSGKEDRFQGRTSVPIIRCQHYWTNRRFQLAHYSSDKQHQRNQNTRRSSVAIWHRVLNQELLLHQSFLSQVPASQRIAQHFHELKVKRIEHSTFPPLWDPSSPEWDRTGRCFQI